MLYVDGDTLLGQVFDAAHLELRGEPFTVAEHVGRSTGFNIGASASGTGMLAYAAAVLQTGRLTWFDRAGIRSIRSGWRETIAIFGSPQMGRHWPRRWSIPRRGTPISG